MFVMNNEKDIIKEEVQSDLAELFLWWYGKATALPILRKSFRAEKTTTNTANIISNNTPPGIQHSSKVLLPTSNNSDDIPVLETETCWKEKWFAKGDLTHQVDSYLRERFGHLLLEGTHLTVARNWIRKQLWETLALIVLFDQVSRNIHRGTPKAYATDDRALELALGLLKHDDDDVVVVDRTTLAVALFVDRPHLPLPQREEGSPRIAG